VEFRPQPAEPFAIPDVLPFVGWHVEDHGDRHVVAGSIISPGQSGFINPAGQQDPHYEDQHELYAGWEYKPMPLAEDDVRALGGDRVESLSYTFSLAALERAAGTDRLGTAVAASQHAFDAADTVVIASAGDFPDALGAAPLAHDLGGPLLLVGSRLDDRVRTELGRLGATEAVIVGGGAAVGAQAEADLQAAGLETRRVAGADRFATAAAVARELGDSFDEVFVASGRSFADALSAGPVAAGLGIPILLVEPERLPAATAQALDDLSAAQSWVLGGSAAISNAVVEQLPAPQRLAGADRFATSVAVARFGLERGLGDGDVYVATGGAFPDGLTAGPVAAATGGVLLLVDGAGTWSATPVFGHLANGRRAAETVVVFGGEAAVSADVAARAVLAVSQR
jgi:putative cell wall-binding protein